MTCAYLDMFSALFNVTADAVTELQVSNSKLAEVEASFTTQKSEVRFFVRSAVLSQDKPFRLSQQEDHTCN